jgi:hypothetical protein
MPLTFAEPESEPVAFPESEPSPIAHSFAHGKPDAEAESFGTPLSDGESAAISCAFAHRFAIADLSGSPARVRIPPVPERKELRPAPEHGFHFVGT